MTNRLSHRGDSGNGRTGTHGFALVITLGLLTFLVLLLLALATLTKVETKVSKTR